MDYVLMGQSDARRLGMIEAALKGRITNQEGADALGISRRQFRRLRRRVRREGAKGVVHRSRGRPSGRRLAEALRRKVIALLTQANTRLNDCHIADLLGEQGSPLSADTVRRIRLTLQLPAKRRRRPVLHRQRRAREERSGALVLVDGSPFAWLEKHEPFTLVGGIDDATGAIVGLTFRPHEDLHGYAVVLRDMASRHGLPLALYGDRINILVRNDRHWTLEEELQGRQSPTQLGYVLEELGIRYIAAHSPQAKGRVERLWATLQDRLAAELRLRDVHTFEGACAFLPSFVARFNQRFARPAQEPRSAWRRPPRELDHILACRYSRVVARDNTVSIPGLSIQIPPGPRRRSYHGLRVEVRELLDGRVLILSRGRLLFERPAPPGPFTLSPRRATPVTGKAAEQPRPQPTTQPTPKPRRSSAHAPSPQHPWKKRLPIPIYSSRHL